MLLTCGCCFQDRELNLFSKSRRYKNGYDTAKCKVCRKNSYLANREKSLAKKREQYHSDKDKFTDIRLRSKYGIGVHEYNKLLHDQSNRCAICRSYPGSRRLNVDHCHLTNKVRGLLCDHCNIALGHLKDNEERLLSAIRYLVRSKNFYETTPTDLVG